MIQECGAPVPGKIVKWAMLKNEIKRFAWSLFLMSRQVFRRICLLKKTHIEVMNIWKSYNMYNYVNCGVKNCSYIRDCLQLQKESLKKFRLVWDSNPWPLWYWSSKPTGSSWLVSLLAALIGTAMHRYRRGQGFESRTSLIFSFSGFLFATAKSCVYNCNNEVTYSIDDSKFLIHIFQIRLMPSRKKGH